MKSPLVFLYIILTLVAGLLSQPVAQAADMEIKPAPLSDAEKTLLFSEAGKYFREATDLSATNRHEARKFYKKALLRYEKLVDSGVVNGKIYYNIGNTYFRLDDIGNAILNYRRAEKYLPFDPNLTQNLNYAISKRLDKIEIQEEEKILKTLFFWHYDLSPKVRLIIFGCFYILFWLLAALRFSRRRLPRWPLVSAFILALLFGGSLAAETLNVSPHGVLIAAEVTARKGDGVTYQPSFTEPLHAGTEFKLLEERPGWFYIQLADARTCWIPSGSASLL